MARPRTLPAFTPEQREKAHELLALRVAHMMGRKLEEGDWSHVYCKAKGIPERNWSNLNIDVMHGNLGVEHKMLCYRSKPVLAQAFGTTLMHPAATRSIRVKTEVDANEAMHDVLTQYGELIEQRRKQVEQQNTTGLPADMRTGWLLWQESLREFLYFEEEMLPPNPAEYYATWVSSGGGVRKASRNLWIFENSTDRKRYSVTTDAGAKIQPYFDVPSFKDPNVYLFTVIGEQIVGGYVRVWLTQSTAREITRLLGSLEPDSVSSAIVSAVADLAATPREEREFTEAGVAIKVREDAYNALTQTLPGVSDEHCFQLLAEFLRSKQ